MTTSHTDPAPETARPSDPEVVGDRSVTHLAYQVLR